jgi:hypothetical protein
MAKHLTSAPLTNRRDDRLRIWRSLTPAQRDYDRYMGVIPPGAEWLCETEAGALALEKRREQRGFSVYETGCSCHINPPCSFCTREDLP